MYIGQAWPESSVTPVNAMSGFKEEWDLPTESQRDTCMLALSRVLMSDHNSTLRSLFVNKKFKPILRKDLIWMTLSISSRYKTTIQMCAFSAYILCFHFGRAKISLRASHSEIIGYALYMYIYIYIYIYIYGPWNEKTNG